MGLTEKTIKALTILSVKYDNMLSAREFAQKMWPDSKAWAHIKNCGNGATSGAGMWLSAGSYLNKLHKRGLVSRYIERDVVVWRTSYNGAKELEKLKSAN